MNLRLHATCAVASLFRGPWLAALHVVVHPLIGC